MTNCKQQHLLGNAESNQAEKPERFCCYTRSTGLSFKPPFFPKEHQLLSLDSSAIHLQAGKAFTSQRAVSSPCRTNCCRKLCGITASLTFLCSNTQYKSTHLPGMQTIYILDAPPLDGMAYSKAINCPQRFSPAQFQSCQRRIQNMLKYRKVYNRPETITVK